MDLQISHINIGHRSAHTTSVCSTPSPHTVGSPQHTSHFRSVQHHGRRGLTETRPLTTRLSRFLHNNFPTTTESILDTVPVQLKDSIQSLFRATSQAIDAGVVASTKVAHRRFWNAWTKWICINFTTHHPDLHTTNRANQTTLLAAFAHHVCTGGIRGTNRKVCAQTVQVALRAISSTLILDRKQSPLGSAKEDYPKVIVQLLEGYKRTDPPPQPKLAVPITVPR